MNTDNPSPASDPAPAPSPAPEPAPPAHGASPTYTISGVINELCTLVLIGTLAYLAFFKNNPAPGPVTPAGVNFVELGKAYKADLGRLMGNCWTDAGTKVSNGQPIGPTLQAMGKEIDTSRNQLFSSKVSPAFASIVPENTDDSKVSQSQRAALGKAWMDFGQGLIK